MVRGFSTGQRHHGVGAVAERLLQEGREVELGDQGLEPDAFDAQPLVVFEESPSCSTRTRRRAWGWCAAAVPSAGCNARARSRKRRTSARSTSPSLRCSSAWARDERIVAATVEDDEDVVVSWRFFARHGLHGLTRCSTGIESTHSSLSGCPRFRNALADSRDSRNGAGATLRPTTPVGLSCRCHGSMLEGKNDTSLPPARTRSHQMALPILRPLGDRSVLEHVIKNALQLVPIEQLYGVVGYRQEEVRELLGLSLHLPARDICRQEPLGTAHTVITGGSALGKPCLLTAHALVAERKGGRGATAAAGSLTASGLRLRNHGRGADAGARTGRAVSVRWCGRRDSPWCR